MYQQMYDFSNLSMQHRGWDLIFHCYYRSKTPLMGLVPLECLLQGVVFMCCFYCANEVKASLCEKQTKVSVLTQTMNCRQKSSLSPVSLRVVAVLVPTSNCYFFLHLWTLYLHLSLFLSLIRTHHKKAILLHIRSLLLSVDFHHCLYSI